MPKLKEYKTLLITTEHAATGKMGGIGSYNNEIDKLADNILFLLVDDELQESPAENIILLHQYLAEQMPELIVKYPKPEQRRYLIYLVTEHILKRNKTIDFIDTHEYAAEAAIVMQAVKLGLLENVATRVHCHGGLLQLERATGQWSNIYATRALALERSCIENADEVWFSSRYLYQLYVNSGIKIEKEKLHILGLPYSLASNFEKIDYKTINKIVFVGRMNILKGFGVFMHVINSLMEEKGFSNIKEVVAIGKDDGSLSMQNNIFKSGLVSNGINYQQQLFTRSDLLQYLKKHAADSLFILPYYSDNYSVAMLEIIEAGAPLLVLDTGGNKELVESDSWQHCVADSESSLIEMTHDYLMMKPGLRAKRCIGLRDDFAMVQKKRNNQNKARFYEEYSINKLRKNNYNFTIVEPGGFRKVDKKFTHTLVVGSSIEKGEINADIINSILRNACIDYDNNLISFSFTDDERIVCPEPSDLSDIIINNPSHVLILLKSDLWNEFLNEIKDKKIEPTNDKVYIYCLLSYALSQGVRLITCPEPIAEVDNYSNIFVSEAGYMDVAACRAGSNWDIFRYASILRNIVSTENQTTITDDDINKLINYLRIYSPKTSKKGIVIRGGAKVINRSIGLSGRILNLNKTNKKSRN